MQPSHLFTTRAAAHSAKRGVKTKSGPYAPRKKKPKRPTRAELHARAPRLPAGVEARLRILAARLIAPITERLRAHYLQKATRHDAPRPRTVARRELKKTVAPIAHDLARQTHASVCASLGIEAADLPFELSEQAYMFTDAVASILEEYPVEAAKRVAQAFTEWESSGEGTYEGLSSILSDVLDGAEGGIQNSLRLLFGSTFADMNKSVQIQAGVNGYYWHATHDARVRPAHAAMDNTGEGDPYSWDDPPLKADQSSNEEDCHPGDDYNCRCAAIPAMGASPEETDASEDA